METVIFFVLAVIAVSAGVGVVAQGNAVRSALFLLVNFCCLAGLYVLLNAQFVALVQVIVYAGAIVVLFLFVVMLLGIERVEESPDLLRHQWIAGGLLGVLFLAGMIWALIPATPAPAGGFTADTVRQIGEALLTDLVPFEMVSVVLLVAVIGAVVLAKKNL
jgi:NADH-quinone oxidoreductase subunit J